MPGRRGGVWGVFGVAEAVPDVAATAAAADDEEDTASPSVG